MNLFLIVLAGLGSIALIYALRAWRGYADVRADARADFTYKTQRGMVDPRLDIDAYERAYMRHFAPRSLAYTAAALGLVVALTWPAFGLISFLLEQLYQLSGRSRTIEPGFLVWQVMIFLSIIALWATITYLVSRRYYAQQTLSLQSELAKELGEAY